MHPWLQAMQGRGGPSHAHKIRVAGLEDRLGGLAGCDAPGDGHDFAQVAVAGGVWGQHAARHLARLHDPLAGLVASGRDVDDVYQIQAHAVGQSPGGVGVEPVLDALERREAQE